MTDLPAYGEPRVCHCTMGGDCCRNTSGMGIWTTNTTSTRPNVYSNPLPPWPTLEEIRKAIRDELRKINAASEEEGKENG